MKKLVLVSLITGTITVVPAFATDSHTTSQLPSGGTVEKSVDTSRNPLTGTKTTTHETEVKDAAGNVVNTKSTSTKVDRKGQLLRKKSQNKAMNTDGETVMEQKTDEKVDR